MCCVARSLHIYFALAFVLAGASLAQDVRGTLEVQRNLATQLLKSGNYRRAIEEFRKVLAKQPGDSDSLRGISAAPLKTDQILLSPLYRCVPRRPVLERARDQSRSLPPSPFSCGFGVGKAEGCRSQCRDIAT